MAAHPDQLDVTMQSRRWTIGRARDCDYVISHALVSSNHAALEERPDGYLYLLDNGSTNGTYYNSPANRLNGPTPVGSDDVVYFSRQYSVTVGEIVRSLGAKAVGRPPSEGQMLQVDRPTITIGRDPQNSVVLPGLYVSRFHARIDKLPNGQMLLRDLGSTHGTVVNGELIRGSQRPITSDDKIEIAGMTLSLRSSSGDSVSVGVQREGIYIVARGLGFEVPQRGGGMRQLLQDIDFAVFPGEFVGLMGPSGCGKTTLLNVLLGNNRITRGSVDYNGIGVAQFKDQFGSLIGYVPQEDLLHPELTVRQTLYYQARLRLPQDVSTREIDASIDKLCEQLGLFKPGGLDVRDVIVGSPERKGLSGGQRKRLSLAIELLTDPKILYLDEPTSGLSSRDTRLVMELLRELATERNITVIITIHQPATRVYRLLDKVIYLKSGKLGYFGQAYPDSIAYFIPDEAPEVSGPDGVMDKLDEIADDQLAHGYRNSPAYRTNVAQRFERIAASPGGRSSGLLPKRVSFGRQFTFLFLRYLRCRWVDKVSLGVLLVQAPLVALLMCLVFKDQSPHDLLTVLFLLGFVSLWFGVNNSAREIVGELALLRREKRADLNTTAYLFSKIVGQAAITLVQVGLLLGITLALLDKIHLGFGPALAVCWAVSLVGISIGLGISATVKTQIAAVVAVPLILIPVILLGGLIKPFPDMKDLVRVLGDLTPVRWSFEMLTALTKNVPLGYDFFAGAKWQGGAVYLAVVFGLMVYWSINRLKRV
jgi:ABC-type multidrug transport system ATPase subunit/pSer/pThr/pTyr-binding forkhead associated (FHA) protein